MRLSGTILTYGGQAIRVIGAREDLKLHCVKLRNGEEVVIDQDDEQLSFIAPALGYINSTMGAFYLMRQPARRYKQGIDMSRIYVHGTGRLHPAIRENTRALADCFEGVYPTIEQAKGKFGGKNPFKQERIRSVAFSRKFAIADGGNGFKLEYRGRIVGEFQDNHPVLERKFEYLQELLDGVVV